VVALQLFFLLKSSLREKRRQRHAFSTKDREVEATLEAPQNFLEESRLLLSVFNVDLYDQDEVVADD
jgi:hypothetical protein